MKVSVVIPAFNGSRFIEQALHSALSQTRPAEEIIVFDDNSSDDTRAICGRYADRIRMIHNTHGPSGFVNAWNRAIDETTGDFVCILHQDDLLDPRFLALATTALQEHPHIRHLFSTCDYIDQDNRRLSSSYPATTDTHTMLYSGAAYFAAYQCMGQPHIHRCPGVLTHRSIFEQCRYVMAAGHIADDDFFYRVGMYTDVIGILQPLASYRVHAGSVTGAMEDSRLVRQLIADYIYQYRQWKSLSFPQPRSYIYFVRQARRYIRRYLGYALQEKSLPMLMHAIRQYTRLPL